MRGDLVRWFGDLARHVRCRRSATYRFRCNFDIGIMDFWPAPGRERTITLTSFYINAGWRGKGHGERYMRLMLRAADEGGWTVRLWPHAYGTLGPGPATEKLAAWYRRFGFRPAENPGRPRKARGPDAYLYRAPRVRQQRAA